MADNIEVGNLVAKISFDDTGLAKSMAQIDRQMKLVKSEFDKATSALKGYGSEEEKLKNQAQGLNQQMQLQQQRINKLNDEFRKAAREKGEDARETQNLAVKLNQAQTAYNNMENELKQVNAELERQQKLIQGAKWTQIGEQLTAVGDKFKSVGQSMTDIGKDLSMKVTAPITAMGAGIIKTGMDFEAAMSKVQAISGSTGEELEALTNQAKELGANTVFSASQAASGMEFLARAGWEAEEIMAAMPGMLDLAASGALDLGEAADITSNIMSAFSINAGEAGRVADILAVANSNANTNVQQLGQAMTYLAPTAATMGQSIEQATAAVMLMSDAGIQGEKAGAAFSTSLQRLANPTNAMTDVMQQLGIAFFDAQGDMKPMTQIVAELEKATSGYTKEQTAAALSTLFGAEAYKNWAVLVETGSEALAENVAMLQSADGAAAQMAQTMTDNAKGGWTEFMSAVEGLSIALSEHLLPIFSSVVTKLTEGVRWFTALDPEIQKISLAVAGVVAAIGPLLVIGGQIATGIGSIISVIGSLSTAIGAAGGASAAFGSVLAALTGPVGIAVAAIAGIVTTLTVLYKKNEDVRNFMNATWVSIVQTFQQAWQAILDFVMPLIDDLVSFFRTELNHIKEFWQEHGDAIIAFIKPWLTALVGYFKVHFEAIKTAISIAFTLIKNVVKVSIETVKLAISSGLDLIMGIVRTFSKILQGDWKGAWEEIKKTAQNIMDNIVTFFQNIDLVQVGKDIIKGLINGIGSMKDVVVDTVKGIGSSLVTGIKKVLDVRSPSRVMTEVGEWTGQGLANGLDNKKKVVSKSAEKLAKATYDSMKDWIDERKYYNELSLEQELQAWQRISAKYAAGTNQRKAAEREIYRVKQEMIKAQLDAEKAAFDKSKEWIDDRKYYNTLSLQQELAAWQRVQQQYKVGSEQRKTADREVYRVQQEILKAQQEAEKKAFDNSAKWIKDKKEMSLLSLTQELAAWERVQERYKVGSEERLTAEREAASVRQAIYNELKAASDDYLAKVKEVNERVAAEEQRLNQVYEDAVASRAKSIYSFAGLFDEVTVKSDVSGDQLINNLQSQVNTMVEWSKTLEQLGARGVDEGLLGELREMGPKAAAEIAALNSMTDSELNEYQWLWKVKNQMAREQAVTELEGLKNDTILKIQELNRGAATELDVLQKEFETRISAIRTGTKDEFNALTADMPAIGNEIMNGLIKGMDSMKGKVQNKAKEIANSVSNTIKSALQINSPSRVTTGLGEFVGEGLVVGMGKKLASVAHQAKSLATAAVPSMSPIGAPQMASASTAQGNTAAMGVFAGATLNFIMRNDNDARLIAQELDGMRQRAVRGAGL